MRHVGCGVGEYPASPGRSALLLLLAGVLAAGRPCSPAAWSARSRPVFLSMSLALSQSLSIRELADGWLSSLVLLFRLVLTFVFTEPLPGIVAEPVLPLTLPLAPVLAVVFTLVLVLTFVFVLASPLTLPLPDIDGLALGLDTAFSSDVVLWVPAPTFMFGLML